MARLRLAAKPESYYRLFLVHALSRAVPFTLVNEFPKSGGTWLSQMLSVALEIPFYRNQNPALRPSIIHGHYLRRGGMRRPILVWRDGRDVMVSWYHHCFLREDEKSRPLVQLMRKNYPFEDYSAVRENLPGFIRAINEKPSYPRYTWANFVRAWIDQRDVVHVKYEDLNRDAARELQRVVHDCSGRMLPDSRVEAIAEQFSFKNMSQRRPGEENKSSFLRKGIVGDWKNYFEEDAVSMFERFAGRENRGLGYK